MALVIKQEKEVKSEHVTITDSDSDYVQDNDTKEEKDASLVTQQRYRPARSFMRVCCFWTWGMCKYGSTCYYQHPLELFRTRSRPRLTVTSSDSRVARLQHIVQLQSQRLAQAQMQLLSALSLSVPLPKPSSSSSAWAFSTDVARSLALNSHSRKKRRHEETTLDDDNEYEDDSDNSANVRILRQRC
jgi:hypothetical protein